MKIPSNNLWTQTNEGKKLGILGDTFNVNLQTPSQLIGAKKSVAYLHEDLHASMTNALAVLYYNNDYIVITSNEAYTFGLTTTTAGTISSYPAGVAINSDAVICFNRMYVSLDTNLSYWDGSSWTNTIETLTTGVPHPMEVFDSLTTYKLAIGNGSSVYLVDSTGAKSGTELTLPAQFTVTTIRYRNGYLYVGTRNKYGGEARVFIWDGSTANANYEVPVGASWVFSMTPYLNSVVCVTDKGQLLYVTSGGVEELAAFPVYYTSNTRWQDHLGLQLNGKVFNRGMEVVGDSIYINIDGEVDIGECLQMKSGIWIYNPSVGLYHHAQASNDRIRADTSFTISSSEITTSSTHYLKTGDGVVFTNITGLTGVTANRTYYAYVTDVNKLKIAHSRTALQAGTYITIGGSVTSETLMYAQNRDHGIRNHTSGAIGRIVTEEIVPPLFAGDIMYGALVEDLDGTNKYTLQILTDSWNISRFSTQRIYTENIEQSWKQAVAFIDGLQLDNESFIFKQKSKYSEPRKVVTGAWLATNVINGVTSDGYDFSTISTGDELVITDGYGRGYSTFVTDILSSSNTYSITVKDAVGTETESVSFFTTPTKEICTVTNTRAEDGFVKSVIDNVKSTWVSLKGEMRGFQTEVSHLELANEAHKSKQ